MPSNCTAYKCSNNSNEGYALFRYPHDEILKQKWIAAVGRGKNWSPSSSQKLCEVSNKKCAVCSDFTLQKMNECKYNLLLDSKHICDFLSFLGTFYAIGN